MHCFCAFLRLFYLRRLCALPAVFARTFASRCALSRFPPLDLSSDLRSFTFIAFCRALRCACACCILLHNATFSCWARVFLCPRSLSFLGPFSRHHLAFLVIQCSGHPGVGVAIIFRSLPIDVGARAACSFMTSRTPRASRAFTHRATGFCRSLPLRFRLFALSNIITGAARNSHISIIIYLSSWSSYNVFILSRSLRLSFCFSFWTRSSHLQVIL